MSLVDGRTSLSVFLIKRLQANLLPFLKEGRFHFLFRLVQCFFLLLKLLPAMLEINE